VARPAKSLQERVRDRSFLARRHGGLLAGPPVGPESLREIQRRWREENVRRALEREYEKLVAGNGPPEASESRAKSPSGEGFALPVASFFPAMLAHVKGPAAGQAFKLEPWQRRFVEEFSRVNGNGERIYKRGMLGVTGGNGKSPLAAGLALRELVCADDEPDHELFDALDTAVHKRPGRLLARDHDGRPRQDLAARTPVRKHARVAGARRDARLRRRP
jgi:hypothetical protein